MSLALPGFFRTLGFDPLSLNPIIAYEMHESMMTPLASESLDLDPANPSSLDIITATRAGTATYTDASGNIQTASPNTVRVDHVDGVPMILVEPAATNLIQNSEDFDISYWSASNLTITPNADSLGTANVSLLQESTYTSAVPKIQLASGFGDTSGEHTFSFYVKNNNNTRYIGFNFGSSSERIRDTFDLQTETFKGSIFSGTTTGSVSFDRLGDYYRINVTATFPSPVSVQVSIAPLATNTYLFYANQSSDNRSFYLWGAQVETGTVATSYIPTSGSAVTRAADNLVIDGSDFTNFWNPVEGTFYVESVLQLNTNTSFIFDVNNGDTQRNILYYPDSSNLRVLIRKDNATSASLSIGARPSEGVLSRAAFGYATNNLKGSLDGGSVITDTSVTLPTTVNEMTIGSHLSLDDQYHLNGHIKRIIYWPHHSDNL